MSIRDNLRIAMYDRLLSRVPDLYGSAILIGLENHTFKEPKDDPHMYAYFVEIASKRASIGTTNRFNRHTGFFCVDVLVPEKSGTAQLSKMIDAVVDSFEDDHFLLDDGSYVTSLTPQVVGKDKQDGKYLKTVMVKYLMDSGVAR